MRTFNLPNSLTLLRIALTPVAAYAITQHRFVEALVVLFAAGITDGLDGLLARQLHLETRFGAYVDPIADKLLLSACYIALGMAHAVPWWLVGIIFGRDLFILSMAAFALLFTKCREFPPSVWGKLSTFCQIGAGLIVLTAGAIPALHLPMDPFLWIAAAATLWSGVGYLLRALSMLRHQVPAMRS